MITSLLSCKGWRTAFINMLLLIVPVMEIVEFKDIMPDKWLQGYTIIVAIVNLVLRNATTTPPGWKK